MIHPALHTPLVDLLGCDLPIIGAGMGGVARHHLAAAISNAGGFGCMGMVREPAARLRTEVEAYRLLSDRPFAINLIPAATDRDLLDAEVAECLALSVPAVALFWDLDAALVRRLKGEGLLVIHQIGSVAEAEAALNAGVDVLIAQGIEAGGHVRGQVSTLALLPEVVALSPVPVVASGGIGSGAALVAVLALGAQGACCGSAFLATHEANAHPRHKQQLLDSSAGDTVLTEKFFRNWPVTAPVRVLHNAVTDGRHDALLAEGATPVIGMQDGVPVYLFSTDSPLQDATGDIDSMALYAGQSCGQVHELCGAAERIQQMMTEATACLGRLRDDSMVAASAPTAVTAATASSAASAASATSATSAATSTSATAATAATTATAPTATATAAAAQPARRAATAGSGPPAQASGSTVAPTPTSTPDLTATLQELLAAERAGARVAATSLSQTREPQHRALLELIRVGEADSCRRLTACLRHLDAEPTRQISDFYDRAMAISDLSERLSFVDRGQRWVIRRITAELPGCTDPVVAEELRIILRTHEINSQAMTRQGN